jgi:hypothetical protein
MESTRKKNSYQYINNTDSDRTRDELTEENNENKKRKELLNTNLYKSRIIDTEINSSLILQMLLYYNFFYSIMCFNLQLISTAYKVIIIH